MASGDILSVSSGAKSAQKPCAGAHAESVQLFPSVVAESDELLLSHGRDT